MCLVDTYQVFICVQKYIQSVSCFIQWQIKTQQTVKNIKDESSEDITLTVASERDEKALSFLIMDKN